ncbi:protein phosphatase methylesterase 1, partial [Dipodascopsis tothii]|uniref:protein phosphatase methylesterase 1 n=1 Tax=Dipodascopsis tothii TaxID=44089 RepID=UPI0034CD2538
ALAVLDVVEGAAVEALAGMPAYVARRPAAFDSVSDAIGWHISSRTVRDAASARVSVPGAVRGGDNGVVWATDLAATAPFWPGWFAGLSARFLAAGGAKLLVLAGTDRLDRALTIAQMQGRYQLEVVPDAGHFVHEDRAGTVGGLLAEFWRRNSRSAPVLPPGAWTA